MTQRCILPPYPSPLLAASLMQRHAFNDEYMFRLLPKYATQYHRMSRVLELDRRRDLWIFDIEAMNWRSREWEYLDWPQRKEGRGAHRCDAGTGGAGGALAEHVGKPTKAELGTTGER